MKFPPTTPNPSCQKNHYPLPLSSTFKRLTGKLCWCVYQLHQILKALRAETAPWFIFTFQIPKACWVVSICWLKRKALQMKTVTTQVRRITQPENVQNVTHHNPPPIPIIHKHFSSHVCDLSKRHPQQFSCPNLKLGSYLDSCIITSSHLINQQVLWATHALVKSFQFFPSTNPGHPHHSWNPETAISLAFCLFLPFLSKPFLILVSYLRYNFVHPFKRAKMKV